MIDNGSTSDRQQLIHALASLGLDAWELNSGGGTMHVVVTLLDQSPTLPIIAAKDPVLRMQLETAGKNWSETAYLFIATNSLNNSCDVGLLGVDGNSGAQVTTSVWHDARSFDDAANLFTQYWNNRDKWLRDFLTSKTETW